jgi:Domain of Unknown Function (DUF1080)
MDQQTPIEDKKSFLRNDPLLVCAMLTFYGVCILALIGATIWGLDRRNQKISADATSTAIAVATQQANATEQATVGFMDSFDGKSLYWPVEPIETEYSIGSTAINDGLYVWDIPEVKQPFVQWEFFQGGSRIRNFNIAIDSKVADDTAHNTCSGFGFRTASDVNRGAYTFLVCKNSYFHVSYYERGEWEAVSDEKYSSAINTFDWNRIEIIAQGDHFTFSINDEIVSEVIDDRLSSGGLALLVEINEEEPTTVWFDNFWFRSR